MSEETSFCVRCGGWIGPEDGEIRVDNDVASAVCETCLAIEKAQADNRERENE